MSTHQPIFALLLLFLFVTVAAHRLRISQPIALVCGGIAIGFVPGLPRVELDPELMLLAFLPPLLFWEASLASWRDVKQNLRPISLLAVGLVLVTTGVVAVVAHALLPELPWAAAFVLGAVISPTDPIALIAITERLPVPRRIVDVLVGESLVNDATALVTFRFALAAGVAGFPSWGQASGQFLYVVAGGLAFGLLAARGVLALRKLLARDSLHDHLIMFLAPFGVYLASDACGVSAALAVVVAGLYVGRRTPRHASSRSRLQASALWEMVVFVLNGVLFLLVGLQLQVILAQPFAARSAGAVIAAGGLITLVVMATRLLGVFATVLLPRALSPALAARDPAPPLSHVWVLGWAGMRGGVSLAVALAIPIAAADGAPFPGRDAIILITYVVILGRWCSRARPCPG